MTARLPKYVLALALLGCSSSPPQAWRPPPGYDAGAAAEPDLPCEVTDLVQSRCLPCHSDPPHGASQALATYAQWTGQSMVDPSRRVIDVAIELMQADMDRMPPDPAPAASPEEVAVLETWLADGLPMGTCSVSDPYDTPTQCSSGTTWRGGNRESTRMRPGGECIGCHVRMREGPRFSIAGTVYATAHEPDDCNGVPTTADSPVVEITGADGFGLTLQVNGVGNFFSQASVALPYTARVLYQGRVREMITPQESGDCNSCHTETGTEDAPGRVMLP